MPHQYRVQLKKLDDSATQLQFDCQNHDDIFAILAISKGQLGLEEAEHQALIVGLKLFSEVMMQHRKDELFKEFLPHFKQFMGQLKRTVRGREPVSESQSE
ncbi:DUF3861 domain-containing protein [Rheinheimera marina]|uniref:DUF3861 domain-containing protein n=1 Tax=Rheinheimera marina TaxID=1774958 RepID=A0ABV9JPG3_9GAMM